MQNLETTAYFSVVRAFVAGGKLSFDNEALLGDLQKALSIDDDTCTDLLCKADEDAEACLLKQYDKAIVAGPQPAAQHQARPSVSGRALTALQPATSYLDPSYSQPAKKPKKAATAATPATAPRASRPTANSTKRSQARSAPTTPAAGLTGSNAGAARTQNKISRPTISQQSLQRAMQQGQGAMQAYLHELNLRERDIFTELMTLGVDENSSGLNEVHKALLQWYKLDAREAAIEQEIFVA